MRHQHTARLVALVIVTLALAPAWRTLCTAESTPPPPTTANKPAADPKRKPGISPEHVVPLLEVPSTEVMKSWGASIDEGVAMTTLVVDGHAAPDGDGSEATPLSSLSTAIERAKPLLAAGTPTRILLRAGVYRETDISLDAAAVGGKAAETMLVIAGERPDAVILRASVADDAKEWTLVDADKQLYRRSWTRKNGMPAVNPKAYSPATQAISRRREMVFVDGVWLKPVILETYDHKVTKNVEWGKRREGGMSAETTVVDTYTGYRDPREALEPGQFGVAELGPDDKIYDGHPDPDSLFLRLPTGKDGLAGRSIEYATGGLGGLQIDGKNNLVIRNLHFEHYGIAALRITKSRNLLIEDCVVRDNDGGGGSATLRVRNSMHATIRRVVADHNGSYAVDMTGANMRLEDSSITRNNWRGGMSGQAMHGTGGLSVDGRQMVFERCHFDGNYGHGMRQDTDGVDLAYLDCTFDRNEHSGGAMIEIARGPILFRGCRLVGNDTVGLHVNTSYNIRVDRCTIAGNNDSQIDLFPMANRGADFIPGKRFSGPWSGWDEQALEHIKEPAPVIGVQRFRLFDSVLCTTRDSQSRLITWRYWNHTEGQFLDSLAQLQADRNTYYRYADGKGFDAGGNSGDTGNYSDLATWQQVTSQDSASRWQKPAAIADAIIRERIGMAPLEKIAEWEQ